MFTTKLVRLIYFVIIIVCNLIILHLLYYSSNTYILFINILFFLISLLLVKKNTFLDVEYSITFYFNIIISLGIFLLFKYPPNERLPIFLFILFYSIFLIIHEKKKYLRTNRKLLLWSYSISLLSLIICFTFKDKISFIYLFDESVDVTSKFKNVLINLLFYANIPLAIKTFIIMNRQQ